MKRLFSSLALHMCTLFVLAVSTQAAARATENHTHTVKDESGVFTVNFPGAAEQVGGTGKSAAEEQHQFSYKVPNGVFMMTYQDFPSLDFTDREVAEETLKTAQEGFRNALDAETLNEKRVRISGSGVRGVEYELKIDRLRGKSRSRSFVIGHRWYNVVVLGTAELVDSAEANRFLRSAKMDTSRSKAALPKGQTQQSHVQSIIKRLGDY